MGSAFGRSGGGAGLLAPPEAPPSARPPRRRRSTGGPPRGRDGDGFGGGGGGGGDDDRHGEWAGEPPDGPSFRLPASAAALGLGLSLVGVASLFLIFLGAYLAVRRGAAEWPPTGSPTAPNALWLSTWLLVGSSGAMARAVAMARASRRASTAAWLRATLVAGAGFVGVQLHAWSGLVGAGLLPSSNGYGAIFYALTGLHGLHVLGGIGWLGALLFRLRRGRAEPLPYNAVRLCGIYWHFMGALWIVLFSVLYFPR